MELAALGSWRRVSVVLATVGVMAAGTLAAGCAVTTGSHRLVAGSATTTSSRGAPSSTLTLSAATGVDPAPTSPVLDLAVPKVHGPAPVALPAAPDQLPPVVLSSTGIPLAVTRRDGGGFVVTTPCEDQAVVEGATPVSGIDVVIDPGHGGAMEDGATGQHGLKEKDLNLAVANRLSADLVGAGMHPLLTRSGDYTMTIEARAQIVRNLRPRAFVSIHHNAEPEVTSTIPGSETYYQAASPESRRLAGLIWEEVTRALAPFKIPWLARRDAGAKPRIGDHGDDYYGILRETHGTPSALAELAYITDPPEEELLARADVQQVEAAAVARAIVRFVDTRDPGAGFVDPLIRTEPAGTGGGRSPACVDPPLG